jgi:hypothetical protein
MAARAGHIVIRRNASDGGYFVQFGNESIVKSVER